MRRFASIVLAVAVLSPFPAARAGTVVSDTALSPRLHEIVLSSDALEADTTLRVLLPSGYDDRPDDRFPVLYLLHGAVDDYTSWTRETDVESFTEWMDLIVVMPDAGRAGFYSDWYNNGSGGQPAWESFHIGELIGWVDATYRTIPSREGRAIAGLSMGGFGAFTSASRHPDLFSSAASFSGAVDTNITDPVGPAAVEGVILAGSLPALAPPGSVWGQRATEEQRWRSHNPWDLADNLRGLSLTIRTRNGMTSRGFDPIEFGVHEMSVSMHERLDALGIDHVWLDEGPGGHQWSFWENDLHHTLPEIMDAFGTPAPVPFTYTSGETSYDVYGFEVAFDRPVREFSRISDVRPEGLTITGTGTAHVTTAPWYTPGASYTVGTADPDGRLRFDVDLGAPNVFQQHTAPADVLESVLGDAYLRTVHVTIAPA